MSALLRAMAPTARAVPVRDALPADNAALVELASACAMEGDIGICVDRAPDFFALTRLEGERWRMGVVDSDDDSIAGCVLTAERHAWVRGVPSRMVYAGDLKVHPSHRGGAVADALVHYVRAAGRSLGGNQAPTWLTVLAGNVPMELRMRGPRGTPLLEPFATFRAHSVPLLWERGAPAGGYQVTQAAERDIEEMASCWRRYAPTRQMAPVFDAASFADWVRRAPGLGIESYSLARDGAGRLAGFVGWWDQRAFKQLRVTRYSRGQARFRTVFNAASPLTGATPLPAAGGALQQVSAIHLCVPGDNVAALRALVLHGYRMHRGRGYSCLTLGLDVRDPLRRAVRGLLGQRTTIHALVSTPGGRYTGPALDDRPLHPEPSLV